MIYGHWNDERDAQLRALWETGLKAGHIAIVMQTTRGSIAGRARILNLHATSDGKPPALLRADHPALRAGRSIFPTRIQDPRAAPRVLKPGKDTMKLGEKIEKGAWRGMPVYSLTLEERATCPRSCHAWRACYGNSMPFARRIEHGRPLEMALERELRQLNAKHHDGFVVRLHILGDFYSLDYVRRWESLLTRLPALHVFGYTAHPHGSEIGDAVHKLARTRWDRFAVRFSSAHIGVARAVIVENGREASTIGAIVCPAQTGATRSCSTCALCWAPAARDKTIAFLRHGMSGHGRK